MQLGRYSRVAILLHWVIAALILTNLYLGWRMGFLKGLAQFDMFQLHKSVGITILLLSLLRLSWRLLHSPPPSPLLAPWEHAMATGVHWAFYVIMIGMPLSGWLVVSTSPLNIPTLLYHTVPWPHFPGAHGLADPAKKAVNHVTDNLHVLLAFGSVALLALHLAGVVKHQFIDRDPVLGRMLPFPRRVQPGES